MTRSRPCFQLLLALLVTSPVLADQDTVFDRAEGMLPHQPEWHGASESLIAGADDPWITPAERTGLVSTPSYDETVAWLQELVAAAPELEMISIGKSLQGRDFWMVIASAEQAFTAEAMRGSDKPLLLAQAGIHSGEIDGKDAGLMLLRDMTVTGKREELLAGANLLFIPIFNVDGHERVSPYNRINQRGPARMGWRTNARNQNFNRDYAKLATPGVRSIVTVINEWQPDLYVDLHVTDGVDYQYDVTIGGNGGGGWSPAIGRWITDDYFPAVAERLEAAGHIPGPLVLAVNTEDLTDGFYRWTAGPRFSNGYGAARHLPAVLVENHSLKSYRQRVLGTYVLMAATMEVLASRAGELAGATAQDRARRPKQLVLGYGPDSEAAETVAFKGVASERYAGKASGAEVVRWLGEPQDMHVPLVPVNKPVAMVQRPSAWLLPPEYADIAERLALHGIPVEQLEAETSLEVEVYFLPDAKIASAQAWTPNPFEGRVRMEPGTPVTRHVQARFPAGSYRVPADHELGELAGLLLEPQSPDSFFQWGYFLEMFTRTEYAEPYIMEPLAEAMLETDLQLRAEFDARLESDPAFAASPASRLMWFYQRTPFYDQQYLVYPVVRILAE